MTSPAGSSPSSSASACCTAWLRRHLDFDAEAARRLLSSLVTFNLGIELGQALIIATVFPLLLLFRRAKLGARTRKSPARPRALPALGLYWFAERLFL